MATEKTLKNLKQLDLKLLSLNKIKIGTLNIILPKTKTCNQRVITEDGRQKLKEISTDITCFFKKYNNSKIGTDGKNNNVESLSFLKFVNSNMKLTCNMRKISN